MGFAKIVPVGNTRTFDCFEVGEFFRFNSNIWVKYSSHCAVNVSSNDDDESQKFSPDAECEDIEVDLKVL